MPRSCWLSIIAAIGITLASAVGAQPVSDNPSGQPSTQQAQPEPQANKTPLILEAIQNQIERLASAIEAQVDKPQPAEKTERARRDLDAQERMAKWAKWVFWAAFAQAILSGFGIFFIWRNLVQTRRATEAASKAAAAAEAAVAVAQDTAQRELRAYISVDASDAELQQDGKVKFTVRVKNAGQTPAYSLDAWIGNKLAEFPLKTVPDPPPKERIEQSVLGPGLFRELRVTRSTLLTPDEKVALRSREKAVYVLGRVDYRDVFDQPRYTNFRMMFFGTYGDGLKNDTEGNDAS